MSEPLPQLLGECGANGESSSTNGSSTRTRPLSSSSLSFVNTIICAIAVLNCSSSISLRHLANRLCSIAARPWAHGSRWDRRAIVVHDQAPHAIEEARDPSTPFVLHGFIASSGPMNIS
jgi:hypothetical protein